MRVISDHHHGVLWEALALLFVDRFGWELLAWADGHYQKDRGLSRWTFHTDFPGRLVEVVSDSWLDANGADMVIGTTGMNRARMQALARRLGAVYVDQVGNPWDTPTSSNVLRSMTLHGDPGILYHPEFHRLPYRKPKGRRVGSFHTSFATLPCRDLWDRVAEPGWVIYGTEEHPLHPWQVAQARQNCAAIWVCKDQDGYGFAVHEAFASGRPVIGHRSHYEGKLAEPLFERGVTYIEPEDDIAALLANPVPMGLAAKQRFEALVDFDAEAKAIREYLEVLLP